MVVWIVIFFVLLIYTGVIFNANRWFIRLKLFQPSEYKYAPVSIIIPARNEEENIGRCIDSLLMQEYPAELMEIIVVDDQSVDRTAKMVEHYQDRRVKLIRITDEEKFGKKSAVAKGIRAANNEIIVTTDADCNFKTNWLATMVTCKMERNAVMVAAPVAFRKEKSYLDIFQSLDFLSLQGITAVAVSNKLFNMCNGANLLYTKKAFEKVNGFEGIDQIASGDDMLLMEKVDKAFPNQITYCYAHAAIVETAPASGWKEFMQQRIRWASKAKNYKNVSIKATLSLVFIVNLIPVLLLMLSLCNIHYLKIYLLFLLIKSLGELPFMLHVSMFFNKQRLIAWFIPSQIIHTFYTVFAAFFGLITRYEWKGRRVK
jgi:glycosyltransferase involved in cell wall biosynthesis